MKASRFVCLCAAVALPHLALAANSTAPQGLGIVDAILDWCGKVDPKDSAAFSSLKVNVAHGEQASLEVSDAYKNAYALTSQALTQVSKDDGGKACAAGAPNKPPAPPHPSHGKVVHPEKEKH
jgi:hypothetical protein